LCLFLFFGVLHQGQVFKATRIIADQNEAHSEMSVLFYRTYMIPRSQLYDPTHSLVVVETSEMEDLTEFLHARSPDSVRAVVLPSSESKHLNGSGLALLHSLLPNLNLESPSFRLELWRDSDLK
jgi:hypothetical protein